MRKSFDGLCGCVEDLLDQDATNGNLFVFFNKRFSMVKMLLWEKGGFWIYSKRLESGTFSLSSIIGEPEIDMAQLMCIIEGIELKNSYRRKRFAA